MRRRFALLCLAAAMAQASPLAAAPAKTDARGQQRTAQLAHAQAARLQGEIAQLRSQLVQLGAVEAGGERLAGDKKTRLAQLNAQESALTARMGLNQAAVARLIGALELYRRNPPPAFLVYPASAKDAVRAQILARSLAPQLQARSKALTQQTLEVRRLRRVVEAASEDLFRSESDLADQRGRIETLIASKTALETQLNGDATTAQAALRVLADKSGAPGALIARLPSSSMAGQALPAGFIAPVQGSLIARFGQKSENGRSQGLTWRTAPGAPVLAPVAGTVEYAGPLKGWGVVLILATGGAYHLVLAGLQATHAASGNPVAAGEPIGKMADDAASATDLYLEVRRSGEPVDPARWLSLAKR